MASRWPRSASTRSTRRWRPRRPIATMPSATCSWPGIASTIPTGSKLNAAVQEHLKQAPKPELTKVMIASEGLPAIRLHTQGADFFEQTYYLKRGDLNQKLARGRPELFASADDRARSRKALANGPARGLPHVVSPPGAGQLDHRSRRRRRASAGARDRQSTCGSIISAAASWPRPAILAPRASGPRIPSCSTIWPAN